MKTQYSVDQIYNILEDEIVELKIKPNDVLGENSLAARFDVSRTPIRSVLQRLQDNGFVKIIMGKGTFVMPISMETASEIIYLRVAVESMIFRDFIRNASPTERESVRYAFEQMEEIAKGKDDLETFDINLFLKKDLEMHRLWFQSANKMYIWNLVTKPHPDYSRFIRLDIVGAKNVPDVMEDHRKMMEMIDNKSTDGLEELMTRHLYGGVHLYRGAGQRKHPGDHAPGAQDRAGGRRAGGGGLCGLCAGAGELCPLAGVQRHRDGHHRQPVLLRAVRRPDGRRL